MKEEDGRQARIGRCVGPPITHFLTIRSSFLWPLTIAFVTSSPRIPIWCICSLHVFAKRSVDKVARNIRDHHLATAIASGFSPKGLLTSTTYPVHTPNHCLPD